MLHVKRFELSVGFAFLFFGSLHLYAQSNDGSRRLSPKNKAQPCRR